MYEHVRDMNKLTKKDKVHKDLLEYHRLKRRWGLGHIKIKLSKCGEKYRCRGRPKRIIHKNMLDKHTCIMGYYIDGSDTERRDFLGYTLKEAHARLEYIKTFLSLEPLGLVAL